VPRSTGKQANLWAQVGFYSSLGIILPAGAVAGGGFLELLRILKRAEKDADGDNSSPGTGSG
jgi:hypothetical protein